MGKCLTWIWIAAAALSLPVAAGAFDKATGAKDCRECHTLNADEAMKLLGGAVEKVTGVSDSEVRGFWAVDVEGGGGRKGILYIDYSKKYVFSGALVDLATRENLTQERMIEQTKIDASKIPLGDAVVYGKRDAKHRLVIFDDPECPFCIKLHAEVKKVVAQRDDVAFFIKLFPLAMHPKAKDKARAILCAGEKGAQLLEESFAGKDLPAATCQTTQVEDNIKLAGELGIGSTPTIVFPDGRVVPGFRTAEKLIEMIDGGSKRAAGGG